LLVEDDARVSPVLKGAGDGPEKEGFISCFKVKSHFLLFMDLLAREIRRPHEYL